MTIRSTANHRVRVARSLGSSRARREHGLSLAEGPIVVGELVRSDLAVATCFVLEGDAAGAALSARAGVEPTFVTAEVLAAIADTRSPQSPIATFAIPARRTPEAVDQVVVHDLADPGNLGTIIRTAAAFGFVVTLLGATTDPWSPKVVRASAGTVLANRPATIEAIGQLRALGVETIATVPRDGVDLARPGSGPVAILIGSEAHGLPGELVTGADHRMTIPMDGGVESLNAAVAASIAMFALARR